MKPLAETASAVVTEQPSMASLCLLNENGVTAERWDLGEQPVSVGRGATADVSINEASLSRRHFVIVRDGKDYLLKDLNSRNGTFVDGRPAKSTRLHHHDCIVAGRTVFVFSAPHPAAHPELAHA